MEQVLKSSFSGNIRGKMDTEKDKKSNLLKFKGERFDL